MPMDKEGDSTQDCQCIPCQLEKSQKRGGCPTVRKEQEEVESFSLAELEFWMSLRCECAVLGALLLILQANSSVNPSFQG